MHICSNVSCLRACPSAISHAREITHRFVLQVLIGEYTGLYTFLSLIPIMLGLALCSAYELSFNIQGFIAAIATNLTEW